MKTRSIIATTLLSITAAAFAQGEASYEYPQPATSAKSRADVVAELQQARAAGQLISGDSTLLPQADFVSTKSRDEVRALAVAAPLVWSFDAQTPGADRRAPEATAAAAMVVSLKR